MGLTGQSLKRKEDPRFITGKGRYTDDLVLPNQSYAYFVRSTVAHAKIKEIKLGDLESQPGVRKILTGKDYSASGLGTLMCGWMIHSKDGSEMKSGLHPPLVVEKARYVGDPIAVVIADTKEIARTTAERVEIEYEELGVITLRNFDQRETNLHDNAECNIAFDWELGDSNSVTEAAAQSAYQIPLSLYNNRLAPNAM